MEDLNENSNLDESSNMAEEALSKKENIPELEQDLTEEKNEIQDEISESDSNQEIVEEKTEEIENSPEASDEVPSESVDIKTEDANTTNCLALTIQEDHKLVALKNVFLRSIRMSWKVAVSTITLALLKLFS